MACRNREICLYSNFIGIGKKQNWSAIDCAIYRQENQRTFQHLFFRISDNHLRYIHLNITNVDWVLLSSSLFQWVFQENFDLWFSSFQRRFWIHCPLATQTVESMASPGNFRWENAKLMQPPQGQNQHSTPAVPRFYGELLKLWFHLWLLLASITYTLHRYKCLEVLAVLAVFFCQIVSFMYHLLSIFDSHISPPFWLGPKGCHAQQRHLKMKGFSISRWVCMVYYKLFKP